MELYHASTEIVEEPRIFNRYPTLDFGTGFYTTMNEAQACEFASKVFVRRGKTGRPVVNVYDYDELTARETCEFLLFRAPDKDWLEFVVHNRSNGRSPDCPADIIVGPVANDDVFATVALYESGLISEHEALQRFKVKDLFNQVLFCNEKALSFLRFRLSYVVGEGS